MIHDYKELKEFTKKNEIQLPALFLDLNNLENNLTDLLSKTKLPIRIATKSIRSVDVLKYILNFSDRFQGLMCYSLNEALWLRSLGFKDLLVAYPSVDLVSIEKLKNDSSEIIVMVDSAQHLKLLGDNEIQIAIDLNMSTEHLGIYFGVKRSSINNLTQLKIFLDEFKKYKKLKLVGVMGYEAQIAGVADLGKPIISILKKLSIPKFFKFRQDAVKLIHSYGHQLKIINGGGSGSAQTSEKDSSLTEITVGSIAYKPTLFDGYINLQGSPSLFYAIPVVRQPQNDIYTCYSGGFVASGAFGQEKYPQLYLPKDASFLTHEGAGEVQTPITLTSEKLELGDPVFLRHAKAGEVCERFNEIIVFKKFEKINTFKTYRGEGVNFS